MLYLYTIMMLAWDLDEDTHSYFREYLDGFINRRKISKELREFVGDARKRHKFMPVSEDLNRLRINLPNRISRIKNDVEERSPTAFRPRLWRTDEEIFIQGSLDCVPLQGGRKKRLGRSDPWPQMLLLNHYRSSSLIDSIHPTKYHHNARKLSAPSRPNTNP